jgi:hypothetical protein
MMTLFVTFSSSKQLIPLAEYQPNTTERSVLEHCEGWNIQKNMEKHISNKIEIHSDMN